MERIARWAPPGLNYKKELQSFFAALSASLIWSMGCILRIFDARYNLYERQGSASVLRQGAAMPAFRSLWRGAPVGFQLLALVMPAMALWHYLYHYRETRSIYLMRRLPDPWVLHRRCLTLPAAGLLICGLAALCQLFICYGIYLLAAPEGCLPSGQGQSLWIAYWGV